MREIGINELSKYMDPFKIEEEPAIAVADDGNECNGLTIGWAGFGVLWQKPAATVYVHKARYSKHIFDEAEYFAVCFFDSGYKKQIKYFGTVSGRDEDKMAKCGMTVKNDVAPYFEESRLVVLCRKMGQCDFSADSCDEGVRNWYSRDGVHTQYMGEIIKVLVKE